MNMAATRRTLESLLSNRYAKRERLTAELPEVDADIAVLERTLARIGER